MKFPHKILKFFKPLFIKVQSLSLFKKILIAYIGIVMPFLYLHEAHLSIGIILLLLASTILFSVITLILTIYILNILFQKNNNLWFDIPFLCINLGLIYWIGFFKESGGTLLIGIGVFAMLFYKIIRLVLYYRIILLGITILLNALLTFSYLQAGENYLFYYNMKTKYGEVEAELSQWNFDLQNKLLSNPKLPIYSKLPENLFYHDVKSLDARAKAGIGMLTAHLSGDDKDLETEPIIRIFILPMPVPEPTAIIKEYHSLLELWKNRGEIEELKDIGENELLNKKWKGNFWTYFDKLKPRYVKMGYYTMPLESGHHLLIEVNENLITDGFHTKRVDSFLQSITQSIQL